MLSVMSPRGRRAVIAAMQECGWLTDIQPDTVDANTLCGSDMGRTFKRTQ
jgi:hypothetical protein